MLEYQRGTIADLKHLNFPLALKVPGFRAENAARKVVGHVLFLSASDGDALRLCSVENEDMLGQMFTVGSCVPDVTLMPCFSQFAVFVGKVSFPPTRSGRAVCSSSIVLHKLPRFCSPSFLNSLSFCGSLLIAVSYRLLRGFYSSSQSRLNSEE
jgi:hypothetical protein